MWINACRKKPPENRFVIFRDLKQGDKIIKAQYGKWTHDRDGEYESWHINGTFENYLDDGQYWMEIPELP